MRRLRTLSSRRLTAIVAVAVALTASAAVAQAALNNDSKPAPKPLDQALLDAANAPAVDGVSARIKFTNALMPSGSLPEGAGSPIITGATGRAWIARDGRFRVELQSERGDAQVSYDGEAMTVYDASAKTVYRLDAPEDKPDGGHEPATLAGIDRALDRLARTWTLSGAQPTSTAGRPSYTLRISPKDDGGLLGAGEVAWDAAKGVPLRAAVYAQNSKDPVLELEATDISYGPVSIDDLSVTVPAGVKVVDVYPPAGHHAGSGKQPHVSGLDAVQRELGFQLAAPRELAGLPRKEVRLVDFDGEKGALSVYGEGLGGIAVLQSPAKGDRQIGGGRNDIQLPQVNIDGATGTELATALGTVVQFERGGVQYTVLGSVPPVAAENAARGLR